MGDRNAKQINNLVPLTSVNGTGVATVVVTIPAARLLTTGFWRRGQKGGECKGQAGTVFTAGRRASVYPSCVRSYSRAKTIFEYFSFTEEDKMHKGIKPFYRVKMGRIECRPGEKSDGWFGATSPSGV